MEALRNLERNIPEWLVKLDELNSKIAVRQKDLAALDEAHQGSSSRSLKKRGSTESLKPNDEPAAFPDDVPAEGRQQGEEGPSTAADTMGPPPTPAAAAAVTAVEPPSSPRSNPTASALRRQTDQAIANAQRHAKAMVRKKHKTESMVSAEGEVPKYRSRSMIIVYYDEFVQEFFENLVKFVSASRNLIRKAKMHAKVNQIKTLADRELREEAEAEGLDRSAAANATNPADDGNMLIAADPNAESTADMLPTLHYISTRQMGAVSRHLTAGDLSGPSSSPAALVASRSAAGGGAGSLGALGLIKEAPGVYDALDKGLEYVQGMCEHAAHQFLRDGDCAEEVANVKKRLAETREIAAKETARVEREEPDLLVADARPRRLVGAQMRRELDASGCSPAAAKESTALGKPTDTPPLEVDEGIEADPDLTEYSLPKLQYRSTRLMGRR